MASIRDIADVCEGVKNLIVAAMDEEDATVVTRSYIAELHPGTDPSTRLVTVYPLGYADEGLNTREGNAFAYTVGVMVGQRYTSPGDPTNAWVDANMAWVREFVFDVLHNAGLTTATPVTGSTLYCTAAEVVVAFDPDVLAEQQQYMTAISFTFRED